MPDSIRHLHLRSNAASSREIPHHKRSAEQTKSGPEEPAPDLIRGGERSE